MPKPKKATASAKQPYLVKAIVAGKTYEAHGQTVLEALSTLSVPGTVRGKVILIVAKGTARKEWVMPYYAVARLFSQSRIMREVALKNISQLFDL